MPISEQRVDNRERTSFWIRRLAWLQRLSGRVIRVAYSKTGGRVGGTVRGMPVLLLTTTGRRTGLERTTPLIYVRHGGTYAVAASAAGANSNPAWYHNLSANPAATIQVGSSRIEVTARVAEKEERNDLYQRFKAGSDAFRAFEESTSRTIPVIVLQPNNEDTTPATAPVRARRSEEERGGATTRVVPTGMRPDGDEARRDTGVPAVERRVDWYAPRRQVGGEGNC